MLDLCAERGFARRALARRAVIATALVLPLGVGACSDRLLDIFRSDAGLAPTDADVAPPQADVSELEPDVGVPDSDTPSLDAEPESSAGDIFQQDGSLLGHWRLDELQAGARVLDSSGHGINGVPSPTPPTPSTQVAPVGFSDTRSLAFTGQDQVIDLGNPDLLNFIGNITLCAWINANAQDGARNILVHGFTDDPSPKREVALRMYMGSYQFSTWNGGFHDARYNIPPEDLGRWTHLCGAYDGRAYRLYRNGVLVASNVDDFLPVKVDAPWAIGARPFLPPMSPPDRRQFLGLIDDVRIYARALSADDVAALYRQ